MSDVKSGEVRQLVDHLFRHQAAQIVSMLTRIFGLEHLDLAESFAGCGAESGGGARDDARAGGRHQRTGAHQQPANDAILLPPLCYFR